MCFICMQLDSGKFNSKKQVDDYLEVALTYLKPEHVTELRERINNINWTPVNYYDPNKDDKSVKGYCTCGAKYTSFPGKHLKYCDVN